MKVESGKVKGKMIGKQNEIRYNNLSVRLVNILIILKKLG